MTDPAFLKQIEGYGLTTAEILYHLPDQPSLLQLYVWQEYDLAPRFPELKSFLDFWSSTIEGKLHSVVVAHSNLVAPMELRNAASLRSIH